MAEKSLYESTHPSRVARESGMCLGRITAVDPVKRLCTVKTFFASHPSLNDQSIAGCQWLNWDASKDGDEATSIPRRLAIAVVIYIQGEPFIFGYIKGLDKNAAAVTGKEPAKLTEGDKILSTQGGNRITVRSSGLVEVFVKDTLQTLYLPLNSEVIHLCRNYQLKADGGNWLWQSDPDTLETLSQQTFRNGIANLFAVFEDRGAVSAETIYSLKVAPGLSKGTPLYSHEIDITGESRITVGPGEPTFTATIGPDGKWTVEAASGYDWTSLVGDFALALTAGNVKVTADAGDVTLEATAGHMEVHAGQDVALLSDTGDVDAEATVGAFKATGSGAKLKLDKGMVGLGSDSAELLDLFDQLLDGLQKMATSMATETHIGNLGYPTAPPTNAADYVNFGATVVQIKALLATIKGGL